MPRHTQASRTLCGPVFASSSKTASSKSVLPSLTWRQITTEPDHLTFLFTPGPARCNFALQSELPNTMTELNQALLEIRSIRRHVAQTMEFRGYGPATLLATAVVALLAGAAQRCWLPEPALQPTRYVALWLTTGVFCAGLIATQMLTRARRLHSGMADEMIRMAVAQFLPAAMAGLLLPLVLLRAAPGVVWMLPGLWQIIFSLGVFASCRCLPRRMLAVGAWFLLSGMACVLLGDARGLAPVGMAGPYAGGMVLVAAIHSRSARKDSLPERDEDEIE